jgi:diguanylate cyclase (GGDEF)-like protein/PAS domain S-box-containing protein
MKSGAAFRRPWERSSLEKLKMSLGRRDAGLKRLPLIAAAFVVLVCVAILALSGWREWTFRDAALRNAEVNVANLAQSLAQHAEDTFELADTYVIGLVNGLETDGTSPAAIAKLQNVIDLSKPTLGRIRGLFVYDETGRWLATSAKVNFAAFNNSDRDYFQHHRQSADRQMLIGKPVKSRSGGQWIITVSRRFNHPDGSFAGVVLATIDAAYFSQFYREFDVGPNGSIGLLSTAGIMLARSVDNDVYVGRDLSGAPLIKDLHSRPSAGTYYFKSSLDGIWRLSFYKLSKRYPILVLATEAQDDVLAEWRGEATARTAFVLGLTALIAAIGFYLVRQLAERQRMAAALAAKEADFRLLAEESSDMVMRIGLDERILYVSPSCTRVLGWTADQLKGRAALAAINADDLPHVQRVATGLKQGEIEETKIIYRTRQRKKDEIWLETALRTTRDPDTGRIDGVVAISRDMTEHKDLQQKLAALASLDGLTGLANRRHFDEKLRDEWARASRDGTALSLLLMDVDHFKGYNDQHGHQAGDECLISVARFIAGQAQRPADLAARYGGEEFVLLLPGTDAAGCEQIGERIRQALHDLHLPNAMNLPSKCVTMSLGGATGWPNAEKPADHTSLIAAADSALYAAKTRGRNRVVMSGQVVAWPNAESA